MTVKVENIQPGKADYAGNHILCVFAYSPPDYAVYRTSVRVMVQFADEKRQARKQRAALRDLTSMRGEINGLIDGWHDPGRAQAEEGEESAPRSLADRILWWRPAQREQLYKRAIRYDRRVADAIVTALENDVTTARRLLAEVKNDIISERTSMARWSYLKLATFLVVLGVGAMALLARWGPSAFNLDADVNQVWTAVAGGTIGAFFSIAIGLKGRTVLIDLQNRDNMADAILRILIGAIAGGILLCLLVSGLLANSLINVETLKPGHEDYSELMIFIIGFLGGFSERLVPDFLAQTNIGTKEKTGERSAPPTPPTDQSAGGGAGGGAGTKVDDGEADQTMDLGAAGSAGTGAQAQDGAGAIDSEAGDAIEGESGTPGEATETEISEGATEPDTPEGEDGEEPGEPATPPQR